MAEAEARALEPEAFRVATDGLTLTGEELGPGGPDAATIVLLHGLTATRRYVVHRSRVLPRAGFRLLGYDARGHGESEASPEGRYGYERLAADCGAVIESRLGEGRVVLAAHSMGAHTAATYALGNPDRVAGAVFIGPAVTGMPPSGETLAYWAALADGLEAGGVDGFLAAYEQQGLDPAWRETILRFTRERMEAHRHPEGVVRALREVPRSLPFQGPDELALLDLPALVVASHDEADPGHPYAVAEAWAESLPNARLESEETGQSPLAWQGGRLSREIQAFCREGAVRERLCA